MVTRVAERFKCESEPLTLGNMRENGVRCRILGRAQSAPDAASSAPTRGRIGKCSQRA
jgi:hypothetical protein